MNGCWVGMDVGGTFVDIVVLDKHGALRGTKVATTERIFSALQEGLQQLDVELSHVEYLVHGTTVATNALVQKTAPPAILVTTEGFRDILEIRRTDKGDLFNLNWSPPPPIIERANRLEVRERIDWTGKVLIPLDTSGIDALIRIIDQRQVEAVAVVFLHSYKNPSHEQQLRELLLAVRPGLHVSISSDVIASYREFERTATTAANAYIAPVVRRYVDRLAEDLAANGFANSFFVMQSNGGVSALENVRDVPAKTVRSGPAGCAIALAADARRSSRKNMIGLDIGGTTADVSIVRDGEPRLTEALQVEFGLPILFPSIDIASIGAGGGTIAWIDEGGALRAGPRSAGAKPGPACYGAGGQEPTGTDAQLVLGRLSAETFLGGRMPLHAELSAAAIAEKVADPLELSVPEAAAGIIEILTQSMIQTVRLVTIERGLDPRDFVLCAFGGAGALYAPDIAAELSIPAVLVPPKPGLSSAYGVLIADTVHDASQSLLAPVEDIHPDEIMATFDRLEQRVLQSFSREATNASHVSRQRYVDLLYTGQTHTLSIPLRSRTFSDADRSAMLDAFHKEHRRRFGHADPNQSVEFVTLRVFGRRPPSPAGGPATASRGDGPASGPPVEQHSRKVYFAEAGDYVETPVYEREALPAGSTLTGPAILEQSDTTTVVPPGMRAEVEALSGNLLIHTGGEER